MPPEEPSPATEPAETRLKDLRPAEEPVQIIARVVTVERREYTRAADNRRRSFLSGLLSDGTASIRFTWWEPPAEGVERGAVIRAANVQVREFRGRPEVSFGFRTRVGLASPAELPAVDGAEMPQRTISQITGPEEGFRLEGRVVRVAERKVTVGTEQRQIHEGLLADATGLLSFTSWSDFGLHEGEAIRVAGSYVRLFRQRAQLVLDERSIVTRIDGTGLPAASEAIGSAPVSIAGLEAAGGGEAVAVEGTIVGLSPPSGLVYRCPTCRRTISGGRCAVHGAVIESVADLRARLVLDDGTGALTVNAGRSETEKLWGLSLEGALAKLREAPDPTRIEEELFEAVFGRRVLVRGRASRDDFGVTIVPESIEPAPVDGTALAEGLRGRLGARG